jgi:hypothetical protein
VPSEHNPSDFPSRGLRLPGKRLRQCRPSLCPSCGVPAENHPMNVPRAARGLGLFCTGGARGFGHALLDGDWISKLDANLGRMISRRVSLRLLRRCWDAWSLSQFFP